MIELKEIGVSELQYLVKYLMQNRNDIQQIVTDFGHIENNNGYGTYFLRSKNPLFKVCWLHSETDQLVSMGLGGPHLGLSLKDLYLSYGKFNEGFVPYDNEYVYVFYSSEEYDHTVKITSDLKLFDNGDLIKDIPVNSFSIRLA